MALDDILSPPYPGNGATAQNLLNYLGELRTWTLTYRSSLNELLGKSVIPKVIKIPAKEAYLSQPVQAQWFHFLTMRRIREEWDHLVRVYESCWDCAPCVASQAVLVNNAAELINHAFTPFEQREIHEQREMAKMKKRLDRLNTHLRDIMEPGGGSDDEEETEEGGFS